MANIAIIGLGLVGGSLARALAGRHRIHGIDSDPGQLATARAAGVLAQASDVPGPEVAECELVILAGPLSRLAAMLSEILPHLGPRTLVTDVGSVKAPIVTEGRRQLPGRFLGGHPMAGTEHRGFPASSADLFRDAPYVLTPGDDTEHALADRLQDLLSPLEARWVRMSAEDHDAAVAMVSHLPLLASVALARSVQTAAPEAMAVAGSGFRDTSRLAAGNPELGRDICIANRAAVLSGLRALGRELGKLVRLLEDGDDEGLHALLEEVSAWKRRAL